MYVSVAGNASQNAVCVILLPAPPACALATPSCAAIQRTPAKLLLAAQTVLKSRPAQQLPVL